MTTKEIKDKMTQGVWKPDDHFIEDCEDNQIATLGWSDYDTSVRLANAAAICSAVNNTFGKSINPEAIPDMLTLLERMRNDCKLRNDDFNYNDINTVLNNAKIY